MYMTYYVSGLYLYIIGQSDKYDPDIIYETAYYFCMQHVLYCIWSLL